MTDSLDENPLEDESPLEEKLNRCARAYGHFSRPRSRKADPRLEANEDLRWVPLLDEEHNICVGMTIVAAEAKLVHQALKRNIDLFAWTTFNMTGVSPDIITHKLSIYREARLVA